MHADGALLKVEYIFSYETFIAPNIGGVGVKGNR